MRMMIDSRRQHLNRHHPARWVVLLAIVLAGGFLLTQRAVSARIAVDQHQILSSVPLAQENTTLSIWEVAWHPTEEILGVATYTGLHLFDTDLQLIQSIDTDTAFTSLDWREDGTQLAAGIYDRPEVRVYSYDFAQDTLAQAHTLTEVASATLRVAWSSDGSNLTALFTADIELTRASDPYGLVYTWNTTTWDLVTWDSSVDGRAVFVDPAPILSWRPGSTTILTHGSNTLVAYDSVDGIIEWVEQFALGPRAAEWLTEDFIGALPTANQMAIFDFENDAYVNSIDLPNDVYQVTVNSSGSYLFTGRAIIELATGAVVREYPEYRHHRESDWHPTLDLIAATGYNEPAGYHELTILDGSNLPITSQPTLTPLPTPTLTPTRTGTLSPTAAPSTPVS